MDDLDDLAESAGDAAESLGELAQELRELGASSASPVLGALGYAEPVEPLVAYVSGRSPLARVPLDRVEGTVRGPAGAVLARDVEIVHGAREVHRQGWRSLVRLRGREGEAIEIEASELSLDALAVRVHRGAWERLCAELALEVPELAIAAAAEVEVRLRELRAGEEVEVHGVLLVEERAAEGDGASAWREPAGGLRCRVAGRFVRCLGAAGEASAIAPSALEPVALASEGLSPSLARAPWIAGALGGLGVAVALAAPSGLAWALVAVATTLAAVRGARRGAADRVLRVEPRPRAARLWNALQAALSFAVGAAPLVCAVLAWITAPSVAIAAAWVGAGGLAVLGFVWLAQSGPSLALLGRLARPAEGAERTVEGRVWGTTDELASSAWTATGDVVIESVAGIFLARLEGAVWASTRRSGRAVIVGLGDRVLARGRVEGERLSGWAMLCAGDASPRRVLRAARWRAWIDVGLTLGLGAALAAGVAWRMGAG